MYLLYARENTHLVRSPYLVYGRNASSLKNSLQSGLQYASSRSRRLSEHGTSCASQRSSRQSSFLIYLCDVWVATAMRIVQSATSLNNRTLRAPILLAVKNLRLDKMEWEPSSRYLQTTVRVSRPASGKNVAPRFRIAAAGEQVIANDENNLGVEPSLFKAGLATHGSRAQYYILSQALTRGFEERATRTERRAAGLRLRGWCRRRSSPVMDLKLVETKRSRTLRARHWFQQTTPDHSNYARKRD